MSSESSHGGCSVCSICKTEIKDDEMKSKITKIGAVSLQGRGIMCNVGDFNHRKCSTEFAKKRLPLSPVENTIDVDQPAMLRSSNPSIDISNNCFLCGELVSLSSSADKSWSVANNRMRETWKNIAFKRSDERCCLPNRNSIRFGM